MRPFSRMRSLSAPASARMDAADEAQAAEPFGARRAQGQVRADGRAGVRVTTDRLRREAGEDADTDARADDPEADRESRADACPNHVCVSSSEFVSVIR